MKNNVEQNLLVKDKKYQLLVEEIKATITESVFYSRWALIEGYWTVGKLIRETFGKGELTKLLTDLAVDTGISDRTLWRALAAYDKYPDINKIPEGKNITWNKLITKYLPDKKEEKKECDHIWVTKCKKCGILKDDAKGNLDGE
jgi:hypothetical protein